MKIKMTTTAVDGKLLCYQFGKVFTVGKDIDETFANNLIASNLAMVIEEDKKQGKDIDETFANNLIASN